MAAAWAWHGHGMLFVNRLLQGSLNTSIKAGGAVSCWEMYRLAEEVGASQKEIFLRKWPIRNNYLRTSKLLYKAILDLVF